MSYTNNSLNFKEIGIRIRQEREKLGLTRERFAEILDLSPYFIGQLERGDRRMSLDTLAIISKTLNLSTDYILFGSTYYMENLYVQESFDNVYKQAMDTELKTLLDILNGSGKNELGLITEISKLILPHIKK